MIVWMVHEKHGTHACYNGLEVEACKKAGWTVREDEKPEPKPEPKVVKKAAPKKSVKKAKKS